jgi:hypothetical protein
MRLLIWIFIALIGTFFIWYSGVLAYGGEARPIGALSLILGLVFVAAGLLGLKLADDDYASHVKDNDQPAPTDNLWAGLFESLRELFVGPRSS